MAATLIPPTPAPAIPAPPADPTGRTATHRLVILHAEHDGDETLLAFARRVGPDDRVTLANLRPVSAATLPPSVIASPIGMMAHLDAREARLDEARRLDLRIAARSRLLRELGIEHEVVTETYHRSVLGPLTARSLRRAIGRLADRARADEIVVGPGAILECHQSA